MPVSFITLFLDACQQLRELIESSCFKNRTLFFSIANIELFCLASNKSSA